MWSKGEVEYPADQRLLRHLLANNVAGTPLPVADHKQLEAEWRKLYQNAFLPEPKFIDHKRSEAERRKRHQSTSSPKHRFLHGAKADYAFLNEPCTNWLIVPFLSKVPGTSVHVHQLTMNAF